MKLFSVITAATAVGASFFATYPIQAVDFPFRTLGFDYEQQYPCTLIVIGNQPSENQNGLGLWLDRPEALAGLVRYPAECVNEYEGSSATIPTDLQVDCTNRRMGSSSWGGMVFYDEDEKIFTSNNWGSELSIVGKNHESYLHNVIYKPIYQAICQS